MPEEQGTHIVYRGKHYLIPGPRLGPDEAKLRLTNLLSEGPKLRSGPHTEGWEDTSKEAADVLARYPEPNRARDVIPKLAEFIMLGTTARAPAALGAGVTALRGLTAADRVRAVGGAAAKAAGYAGAGYAANEGMKGLGVPAAIREPILAVAGLGTKPGRAAVKAGIGALAGETAAARAVPAAVEAAAPAVAEAAAPTVAHAAETVAAPATELEAQLAASIQAARKPATKAMIQAEEIADKILRWKNENKWSGAQIEAALRNVYGIPPKDGRQMMSMVLGSPGQ